jgi:hypothetical protein
MKRRSLRLATLVLIAPLLAVAQGEPHPAPVTITCRALEVHTDTELKAAIIVFHQRDPAQRSELAELLRKHSGQMVEIQAGGGQWHPAQLERLRSCFGRGMLMLVAEHAQFLLRMPLKPAPATTTSRLASRSGAQ